MNRKPCLYIFEQENVTSKERSTDLFFILTPCQSHEFHVNSVILEFTVRNHAVYPLTCLLNAYYLPSVLSLCFTLLGWCFQQGVPSSELPNTYLKPPQLWVQKVPACLSSELSKRHGFNLRGGGASFWVHHKIWQWLSVISWLSRVNTDKHPWQSAFPIQDMPLVHIYSPKL